MRAALPPRFSTSSGDPSHPDWLAAAAYGIDLALLEARLAMTPHERLLALAAMERVHRQIFGRAASRVER